MYIQAHALNLPREYNALHSNITHESTKSEKLKEKKGGTWAAARAPVAVQGLYRYAVQVAAPLSVVAIASIVLI